MFTLPSDHRPYTDKYFLRSNEILKADNLNPFVRMQVFIRKGPGKLRGIKEALEILKKYSKLQDARIFSLCEYDFYDPKETVMIIEARIQDIIELETMYLGVISRDTTYYNSYVCKISKLQLEENICKNAEYTMRQIVETAGNRPVMYLGARHWGWDLDKEISAAAFRGGATSCSTDIGASNVNQLGKGTIPHVLENIYAWQYKTSRAVMTSTLAFDRHIDKKVPRIALIDYNNAEINDSLATATALKMNHSKLDTVRVDTCGENYMEGILFEKGKLRKNDIEDWNSRFYLTKGVSAIGVHALRDAFDRNGFKDVQIILTSGFSKPEKVKAFVEYENVNNVKLFDQLGVGEIFGLEDTRFATSDVVAIANNIEDLDKPESEFHKVGRPYRPNNKLKRVI